MTDLIRAWHERLIPSRGRHTAAAESVEPPVTEWGGIHITAPDWPMAAPDYDTNPLERAS